MNSSNINPMLRAACAQAPSRYFNFLNLAALSAFLLLPGIVRGQLEISNDFNGGTDVGWTHYMPTTAAGANPTYTFPSVGLGDQGYEMIGPPLRCEGLLQRGGAYRSESYSEFFYSADFLNYRFEPGTITLFGFRMQAIAPLSSSGNFAVYLPPTRRQKQGLWANLAFTSEVISTFVDAYRGGAAAVAAFPTNRPLRMAMSGDVNTLFKAEIYDRTDLLEPLVRVNFQDYDHTANGGGGVHSSGQNFLGWLNTEGGFGLNTTNDFTFDNYHATAVRTTPVGYPGTPQVVNLVPGAQTLFYSIPATNQITFTATTFTANQLNTNTMKLFLNDADVSSGLSFLEVRDPIIGTHGTNFAVRWNGTLASNTVYHGQIRALDTTGKGTTNNWYFDTFTFFNPTNPANPSKFVLIEAEDFNYGSGQFQDYPLVSGTDDSTSSEQPLVVAPPANRNTKEIPGPQVNGNGFGYFNGYDPGPPITPYSYIVGTPEVDYHVNAGNPDTGTSGNDGTRVLQLAWHQYRTADRVVTMQGTKGGGFDTPRSYRMGLANNASGTSYVPDYIVADMDAGNWLNYTRTFPNTNYLVYLRASSEARQDVRLDEVTSGATNSSQTLALRGQFLVPNTESWTRWRYVPLTDGAGRVQTLNVAGVRTLRLTANEVRRTHSLIELGDLQLNWMLLVPTNGPVSTGPWIASAKPSKDSVNFDPAGTVKIVILNRGTAVVPGGIQLRLDGVNVTSSATITPSTTEGPGATVSYVPGLLLPKSTHSLSVVYGDGSTTQSNYWNFTVDNLPLIPPGHSLAGAPDSAFTVQVHKATNDVPQTCQVTIVLTDPTTGDPTTVSLPIPPIEDSIASAERQLAGQIINSDTMSPFVNEVDTNGGFNAVSFTAPILNFEQCGGSSGYGTDTGFFTMDNGFADTNFPAILPTNYCAGPNTLAPNFFAVSASIKLLLSPGVYRMGVTSQREFKVTTGPVTGNELYLGGSEDDPGTYQDGQFEFAVQSPGLYRMRVIMEKAKHEDNRGELEWYWVNRTTGVRDLVKPLVLESATNAAGPYSADLTGYFDPVAKTVTAARSGNARFYRLRSSTALTISSISVQGNNVLLSYQ
jgi:hypothetical protein